ncbi:EscU/YscU/HrcU family type III secretion system export apparatus switch protein [Sporolactobacillus vineae]|uniref:EscU/YscU/HrcU family type III secretion system export apparatus switch protein n=1 Tax=Sporolactobacillus vineae TaxID=444463 RepID=UPI00028955E9|nr:EscU/YscU/HrcU family type III secretion system export apparatus switch protein [Sporolactobacillus vineae]
MKKEPMSTRKKAVALNYVKGQDQAPYVSAKGEGNVAKKIIDKAREADIPVQKDPGLVSMLSGLDLNEMIPPELYGAVAEIFSYIYRIDEKNK